MSDEQKYKIMFLAGCAIAFSGWNGEEEKKKKLNAEFRRICEALKISSTDLY